MTDTDQQRPLDGFDDAQYQEEMRTLVVESKRKLTAEYPGLVIYTVSLWTDPNAAVSAINFDTREHSVAQTEQLNLWQRGHHDRLRAEGREAEAAGFLPLTGRNTNPADFALRTYVRLDNLSFPHGWAEQGKMRCWRQLAPALRAVAAMARGEFRDLPLDPEAQIGVNSRHDWYHQTWTLVVKSRAR